MGRKGIQLAMVLTLAGFTATAISQPKPQTKQQTVKEWVAGCDKDLKSCEAQVAVTLALFSSCKVDKDDRIDGDDQTAITRKVVNWIRKNVDPTTPEGFEPIEVGLENLYPGSCPRKPPSKGKS